MKKFSDNEYLDAIVKTLILLLTYHVVLLILGLSIGGMFLPFEVHLQNPLLVVSALAVLYLAILFIVKKTRPSLD